MLELKRNVRPVVLALLIVALIGCGGKKQPQAAGSPATTPGATVSSPGSSSGASPAPSPGSTGGGSPTSGTSTSGPAPGAQPFSARPSGLYSYTTSGKTELSGALRRTYQMPARTTLFVHRASGATQRAIRDLRDAQGNGRVTETRVRSAVAGLHLEFLKNTTKLAGVTDVRTFEPNPPPLILRSGAPNGDHLTFTLSGEGVTALTEVDVLRRETITIGGTTLQAFVIQIHTTFSGDVDGESTDINWIRPADGLLLREQSASSVSSGVTQVQTNYTATLQRLSPE